MGATGISCSACDVFEGHPVKIQGKETARLVSCGACHRTWFRSEEESFVWREVTDETELQELQGEFETVWI